MRPDLPYWLALTRFPKFGAVRIGKLARAFASMREAFSASAEELAAAGIEPHIAQAFVEARLHLDPDKEFGLLEKHQVQAVTVLDAHYPSMLKQIYDPPAVLFYRGLLPLDGTLLLAVVGSRHPTSYGERVVEELVPPVVHAQVGIVSGLALGIDAFAHRAALTCGGLTFGVLGSGVDDDNIYPSHHRHLASEIIARGGAILSEFPIGTHPMKQHFPFRNRVIAGLCHGTLVIEAAEKSGSLITAREALENGRDVFAVPGPIFSLVSKGTNDLLKHGAVPTTSAKDMLEHLGIEESTVESSTPTPAPPPSFDNAEEKTLYEELGTEPMHIDELVRASGLAASVVTGTLSLMEIKGIVKHVGGMQYVRTGAVL